MHWSSSGSFHGQRTTDHTNNNNLSENAHLSRSISPDKRHTILSHRRHIPADPFLDDESLSSVPSPSSPRQGRIFPVSGERRKLPLILMSFVILGMASIYISREAVINTAVQVHIMEQMQLRVGGKVRDTAKELYAMQREADALMKLIQPEEPSNGVANSVKSFRAMHDMKVLETKVTREKAQVSQLIQKIKSTSLIEVRKKYGHDPIKVGMELLFPDAADGPTHFIIELVPAELLPHTVLTFLDMVSSGLLNGCSFILNAQHAIKAAPIPYDGSSAIAKAEAFTKAGLDGVVFREYSHLYPHKKNTVGFAVDGSPAFYINTADNRDIHDDEPCFGVITSGFDTIKRLDAMPTRNNIWHM
ncbi:hypothetical protein FisN_3Lh168 [Fistulifera solaris]|uniref:PPIase cyclophilin-type domain-containing protein n=1 Tax=Fistulifera solaris TaxID=1519565 RepID=A0A1Z5JIJ1_FISSO|nr:hypothetical protein FisN_3Lh168 [Fistulifera solaris]|eukprot:GAX13598.1 hypothetical protein FisN_3Lh168 [Fistulifera solaris]